ncbi:MAG: hypothetical protein ACYDA5_02260 [Vulcanimicrobiaceae bacterium]
MSRLIIEGVTGAGKSQTIAALRVLLAEEWKNITFYDEEATFGDFMGEWIERPDADASWLLRRLGATLRALEDLPENRAVLIERCHLSYEALWPQCSRSMRCDRRLARLGFDLVLLTLPERALKERSLYRVDQGEDWSRNFIEHYGSERAALGAIRRSQRRRVSALSRTTLPALRIDTGAMAWPSYAEQILAWQRSGARRLHR